MGLARIILALALLGAAADAQDPKQGASPSEANYEFFSGAVAELPEGKVTVSRAVLGKPAENRTFLINGDTKVEGELKVNARVTVGFRASAEGDVAARIIVRETPAPKKK